jgi:flagellar protein FlbD
VGLVHVACHRLARLGVAIAEEGIPPGDVWMLKLTRLNNHTVAINPDHIGWADATPDTTLALIGGEKIIVRESLDELIALVIEFRRLIRASAGTGDEGDRYVGDPLLVGVPPRRSQSDAPPRLSTSPASRKELR